MIVKILKEFALNGKIYRIGETVDTTPDRAEKWISQGLAQGDIKLKDVGMRMVETAPVENYRTYKLADATVSPRRKRK